MAPVLHTVLYPDSPSAPPRITVIPHLLLQLLLNLRSGRSKRLLLEQISFDVSGLWWCSSSFSHPGVITGPVPSWLPVGERQEGHAWLSSSNQSFVAFSFPELGSAANTPRAALAAARAAFSTKPQGEADQKESLGAMRKAKVHGGVSSTTAAIKLQAAPSSHGHSLPNPITPKSQA